MKSMYVGIDIGKTALDVSAPGLSLRVQNNASGFRTLLQQSCALSSAPHFICESSSYARRLAAFLNAERYSITLVNPFRARQFASATGRLAKTDRIDAAMLAEMGRCLNPAPTPHPDKTQALLLHVSRRRGQLMAIQRTLKIQHNHLWNPKLRNGSRAIIAAVEQQIRNLDLQLSAIVSRSPALRARIARFCMVPGIGRTTAIRLLAEVPELGTLDRKRIASLAGVAPYTSESGENAVRRHIHGGRLHLRETLFMPAMVALVRNPVLRPFYRKLRERGKPHRVALVAVMRKLLIYLNHLARETTHQAPLIRTAAGAKKFTDRGAEWATAELDRLGQLVAEGVPYKLIAEQLGRSLKSVSSMASRNGIRHIYLPVTVSQ